MTLQQLQYAVTVASVGTITEAAERLYITQPSLTTAIRELEKEMNLTIFIRSNRGVAVSKEGEVFLGYARQILEQTELLKELPEHVRYINYTEDMGVEGLRNYKRRLAPYYLKTRYQVSVERMG